MGLEISIPLIAVALAATAVAFGGGGNTSKAMGSAVAAISANTVVNVSEQCAANQNILYKGSNVTIGNITCKGKVTIGGVKALQNATCTNKQNVSVISKIIADQAAKITSATGGGFANAAMAGASTSIDMQNNVSVLMSARCNNTQNVTVGTQMYQIGNISSDSSCDILNSQFTQNSACIQDILAQIENSNDLKQTVEASATAGGDMSQFLLFIFMILLIVGFIFIGGPLLSKLGGGGSFGFLKSGDSNAIPLSDLRTQLAQLKSQANALGLKPK